MDIHALKRQGMTISEIARRTNHHRKTIRAYLSGQRTPGVRQRAASSAASASLRSVRWVRSCWQMDAAVVEVVIGRCFCSSRPAHGRPG